MSDSAETGGPTGEYTEGASLVQAAWKAVQGGQVQEAEQLYREALSRLELEYGTDHQHIAACLESIGDVCSAQEKFEEAQDAYLQALDMKERLLGNKSPAFVSTLFKLAKIYEGRSMLDEAEYVYKQAMPVAKEILLPGHPLLNNLLDGYAAVLKRRQRRTEKVAEIIEGLARSNLDRVSTSAARTLPAVGFDEKEENYSADDLEALVMEQSPAPVPGQDGGSYEKADARQRRQSAGRLRKAASPIAGVTAGVLGAIITIGITFGGAGAYLVLLRPRPLVIDGGSAIGAKGSAPAAATDPGTPAADASANTSARTAFAPGKTYVSLDDKTAVTFVSAGELEMRSNSTKSQLRYMAEEPHWMDQFPDLAHSKAGAQQVFRLAGDHLVFAESKILYRQGSPELSVKDNMLRIASAVQKYYFLRNEYPSSANEFNSLDVSYTNPVTKQTEMPDLQILKSEQGWDPRRPGDKSALEIALEKGGTWPTEPPLKPGAIHCFVMCTPEPPFEKVMADPSLASRGLVFCIHGCDGQGRLLPSTASELTFLVVLKEGRTVNNLDTPGKTLPAWENGSLVLIKTPTP